MEQENCSAKVTYRDIKRSVERFVHDFEGRRVDLGASIKEEPGIGERTVSCTDCNIHEKLTAEGVGYGPYNMTEQQALALLRKNCKKWQARVGDYEAKKQSPWRHLYSPPDENSFFPR